VISLALENPLAAGRMAHDPCLPYWLQSLAGAITTGDLKPTLREGIKDCINNPMEARQWKARALEWGFPNWFVKMAELMENRKNHVL
jgi:hypothetical protein